MILLDFFKALPGWVRKLLPLGLIVAVAVIACTTDLFSAQVQQLTLEAMKTRGSELLPVVLDVLIACVILNIAWLLRSPITGFVKKLIDRTGASEKGKYLALKIFDFLFWGCTLFVVISMFASEFMGKFMLGFGVLGAALTFAMQGVANDIICGILMQFSKRVQVDDHIHVIGMEVEGEVLNIGYVSTIVKAPDGHFSVPNRKIWESALKSRNRSGDPAEPADGADTA